MTTLVWILSPLLTAVLLLAGQTGSLVEQFRNADHYGKMRIISESVLGKRPASDEDIRNLLLLAMKDPDASVRVQAVGSVATILTLSSMPVVPQGQEWTAKLRPVAETLQAELNAAAADDSDARVRMEALRGIFGPVMYRDPRAVLPKPMVTRLVAIFEKDPSPQVRRMALQGVTEAHGSEDPEVRRLAAQVLLRGLEDSDPYIVQAAGLSAGRSRIPEALPLLVKQLKNPSRVARMGVAGPIAAYREDARPYLPQLQAALAAETDDITRKTIAGTISVITK